MKKGITPIISVIILLLITIGLASAAWTYMSVYMTNLMGKNLEVLPPICIGGTQVSVIIRNVGTNNLVANDIFATDVKTGTPVTISWFELNGSPAASPVVLSPQTSKMAKLSPDCTVSGTSNTCSYNIVISGSSSQTMVQAVCSG